MSDILNSLLKEAGNEYSASVVAKGIESGDITSYVPTGSFALNALLSGSIYGGIPGNKVYAYAGEPSTGKTFFAINAVKRFLKDNPKGFCFYFETESAITSDMLKDRGVDINRIAVMPVTTVQEFRSQALRIVNAYLEKPKKDRPPMLFVLDSLGNLSTEKEMQDIAEGKETRDMTRSQLIKGAFRVLTLNLGLANVALICTNHVYDVIGSYVPMKKMGGGCLVSGTKIKTLTGDIEIQDIKIGDFVETLMGPQKVIETYSFNDKDVFELELDGAIIRCSGDHKFLVDGRWISTYDLVDLVRTTKNINISDIKGDINVFRKQIQENLYAIDA